MKQTNMKIKIVKRKHKIKYTKSNLSKRAFLFEQDEWYKRYNSANKLNTNTLR